MTIPELTRACKLHDRILQAESSTEADEKARRALWLRAVAKGATWQQITDQCGVSEHLVGRELAKARKEATDPALKTTRLGHGGLKLGDYWCPESGCERAEKNGNEPFASAQAAGLHRVKKHGYRIGAKKLTARMVRAARKSDEPTSVLARRWGVSVHALGAARSRKTWRSLDA